MYQHVYRGRRTSIIDKMFALPVRKSSGIQRPHTTCSSLYTVHSLFVRRLQISHLSHRRPLTGFSDHEPGYPLGYRESKLSFQKGGHFIDSGKKKNNGGFLMPRFIYWRAALYLAIFFLNYFTKEHATTRESTKRFCFYNHVSEKYSLKSGGST